MVRLCSGKPNLELQPFDALSYVRPLTFGRVPDAACDAMRIAVFLRALSTAIIRLRLILVW